MQEKLILIAFGALFGALVSLGIGWLKTVWIRKGLTREFEAELSQLLVRLRRAQAGADWSNQLVQASLERIRDFYKLRNPAGAFTRYSKKLDVYEYHSEIDGFLQLRECFRFPQLPLEIRLQTEGPTYDPAKSTLPKRAPLDRIQELNGQFNQAADLSRNGSIPASRMLIPLANLLFWEIGAAYGSGRAGAVLTQQVRQTLDELYDSFPRNAFRRLILCTEELISGLE